MAQQKSHTKITVNIFTAAKILTEDGASIAEIAKYLKISDASVKYIRQAENYDEYKAIVAAVSAKQTAKRRAAKKTEKEEPKLVSLPEKKEERPVQVVEHRQTVTVQATWAMTQEMQKTNKLLESISNKLAFIVDELCGTKGAEAK